MPIAWWAGGRTSTTGSLALGNVMYQNSFDHPTSTIPSDGLDPRSLVLLQSAVARPAVTGQHARTVNSPHFRAGDTQLASVTVEGGVDPSPSTSQNVVVGGVICRHSQAESYYGLLVCHHRNARGAYLVLKDSGGSLNELAPRDLHPRRSQSARSDLQWASDTSNDRGGLPRRKHQWQPGGDAHRPTRALAAGPRYARRGVCDPGRQRRSSVSATCSSRPEDHHPWFLVERRVGRGWRLASKVSGRLRHRTGRTRPRRAAQSGRSEAPSRKLEGAGVAERGGRSTSWGGSRSVVRDGRGRHAPPATGRTEIQQRVLLAVDPNVDELELVARGCARVPEVVARGRPQHGGARRPERLVAAPGRWRSPRRRGRPSVSACCRTTGISRLGAPSRHGGSFRSRCCGVRPLLERVRTTIRRDPSSSLPSRGADADGRSAVPAGYRPNFPARIGVSAGGLSAAK